MDINITQTCVTSGTYCEEYLYSGRIDNFQMSIPMLEAMGLLLLWIVVCSMVVILINKFA